MVQKMSNKSELKDEPYPCENCLILPMCLSQDQYDIAMKCDTLVDHLIDKYKEAINHFGRCCIIVTPLDKKFEMTMSHEERGIVVGSPDILQHRGQRRILVNPYYPRNKVTVVKEITIGRVK